jgi:predicted TPR repeat methyltransferase
VSVELLKWGASSAVALLSRVGRFDLVLAVDVLYSAAAVAPLLAVLLRSLSATGHFLMAHTPRVDPGQVAPKPC